jgi:hypothetical protein
LLLRVEQFNLLRVGGFRLELYAVISLETFFQKSVDSLPVRD